MKEVKSQAEFENAYAMGEREFNVVGFVVVLRGSSSAVLWGSSRAELWESSSAELRESSSAVLWESSRAVLRDFSSAYKLSKLVKIKKGTCAIVIIPDYPDNMKDWCSLKGIKIKKNRIKLWKCTNKYGYDFYTEKILYDTKKEIICPDWKEHYEKECGYALHLADSPQGALFFCLDKNARLFEVSANINDCKCFGGNPNYPMKIRAKKCRMVKEYPIQNR